jgi:hypothetical protein
VNKVERLHHLTCDFVFLRAFCTESGIHKRAMMLSITKRWRGDCVGESETDPLTHSSPPTMGHQQGHCQYYSRRVNRAKIERASVMDCRTWRRR